MGTQYLNTNTHNNTDWCEIIFVDNVLYYVARSFDIRSKHARSVPTLARFRLWLDQVPLDRDKYFYVSIKTSLSFKLLLIQCTLSDRVTSSQCRKHYNRSKVGKTNRFSSERRSSNVEPNILLLYMQYCRDPFTITITLNCLSFSNFP